MLTVPLRVSNNFTSAFTPYAPNAPKVCCRQVTVGRHVAHTAPPCAEGRVDSQLKTQHLITRTKPQQLRLNRPYHHLPHEREAMLLRLGNESSYVAKGSPAGPKVDHPVRGFILASSFLRILSSKDVD